MLEERESLVVRDPYLREGPRLPHMRGMRDASHRMQDLQHLCQQSFRSDLQVGSPGVRTVHQRKRRADVRRGDEPQKVPDPQTQVTARLSRPRNSPPGDRS